MFCTIFNYIQSCKFFLILYRIRFIYRLLTLISYTNTLYLSYNFFLIPNLQFSQLKQHVTVSRYGISNNVTNLDIEHEKRIYYIYTCYFLLLPISFSTSSRGSLIYFFFHFTLSSRSRSFSLSPRACHGITSYHCACHLHQAAPPAAADSRRRRYARTRAYRHAYIHTYVRTHTYARTGAARLRVRSAYRWIRMSRR